MQSNCTSPRCVAAAIACCLAVLAPPATAQVPGALYVDRESRGGGCSDSRSSVEAAVPFTPWCSLKRAVDAAPAGSLVLVRGGSYPLLDVSGSNGRAASVRFQPAPGEPVVVDGIRLVNSSYLRFEGFTVEGPVDVKDGAHHVELVGNHLPGERLWLYHTDSVLVERNHIHDIPAGASGKIGIRLIGDTNAVVRGNTVENLVEDPIQTTSTENVLIEGNLLRNAHPADGEHTDAIQTLGADGLVIRGNYIRDIAHGLMFTDKQASDVTLENNVVSLIEGQPLKAEGGYGMPNLRVVNNTIVDSGGSVDFRVSHPNSVVRNNIFHKATAMDDQGTVEHNLVGGSPRFVNAAAGDYELGAGSPAIDAGSGAGTATDRLGRPRLDVPTVANRGTGTPNYVDLGAQEFQVPLPPSSGGALPGGSRGVRARLSAAVVRRVSLRRARRRGVMVRVGMPRGHRALRLTVLRKGRRVTLLKHRAKGITRVRVPRRALRRPGRYTVVVRSGTSFRSLTAVKRIRFRVTR
jgi:Right handed beta helix region